MSAKNGWNAAQLASERKLSKPKKMLQGPGQFGRNYEPATCEGCGYQLCNCKMVEFSIEIGEDEPETHPEPNRIGSREWAHQMMLCGAICITDTSPLEYRIRDNRLEQSFYDKNKWTRWRDRPVLAEDLSDAVVWSVIGPALESEPQAATDQASYQARRPCDPRLRAKMHDSPTTD